MSETPPSSDRTYILGHDLEEIERLVAKQGQILNPFTRCLLEDAGVRHGMKVLDVGCGPGEVSLIAAELVGKEGSVLGIDSNPFVIEWAQRRAQAAHLPQLSFQVADVRTLTSSQQFDAIIGRLVLKFIPEPAAVLRQIITHLRLGGLVAFQEFDIASCVDTSWPPSPLLDTKLGLDLRGLPASWRGTPHGNEALQHVSGRWIACSPVALRSSNWQRTRVDGI